MDDPAPTEPFPQSATATDTASTTTTKPDFGRGFWPARHRRNLRDAGWGRVWSPMSQVLPCLKPKNLEHCGKAYPKSIREFLHCELVGRPKLPRLNHLPFTQFVGSDLLPVKLPTFLDFILHVLGSRSKPQMVRVDTRWIVTSRAVVKNTQTGRNWTLGNNPRSSRRNQPLAVPALNRTISMRVKSCRPNPTGISFVDLSPKSCWEILGKTLRSQVLRRNLNHSCSFNAVRVTGPTAFSIVNPRR